MRNRQIAKLIAVGLGMAWIASFCLVGVATMLRDHGLPVVVGVLTALGLFTLIGYSFDKVGAQLGLFRDESLWQSLKRLGKTKAHQDSGA